MKVALIFGFQVFALIASFGSLYALLWPHSIFDLLAIIVSLAVLGRAIYLGFQEHLADIVRTTLGSMLGAILGIACLGPVASDHFYYFYHSYGRLVADAKVNLLCAIFGTIAGALIASLVNRAQVPHHRPPREFFKAPHESDADRRNLPNFDLDVG